MPLDRETEALLHWISTNDVTRVSSLSPEAARQQYRENTLNTDIVAPPIGETMDFSIEGPLGPIPIRRYEPESLAGAGGGSAKPGILFLHGGGCVIGDLETHDTLCRTICHDSGAVLFSVDYRLAPEHLFPAAVDDGVAALQWLSDNAAEQGIDPTRIAIAGDSAGGGIAAVGLHECHDKLRHSVKAQVLIYPVLDLRARLPSRKLFADTFPIPEDVILWFFNHYFGTAWPCTDPRAIPLLYPKFDHLPPTLIITAGYDPLRDEAAEYADILSKANVPVIYECCEGTVHGFMTMGKLLRDAHSRSRLKIADFLTEHLAG